MIFDNQYVVQLVERWKANHSPAILDLILQQSNALIEAIVSDYDSYYREDLIQEARLRLQYSLPYFDGAKGSLHTFMTTVIKNICLTYLRKQAKYSHEFPLEDYDTETSATEDMHEQSLLLEELIARNRIRFPSIPVQVIDEITESIYESFIYETQRREVISNIANHCAIDKHTISVIYTSSMLHLRSKYSTNAKVDACDELSIVSDLKELFGDKIGTRISIIFTGMTVRFP